MEFMGQTGRALLALVAFALVAAAPASAAGPKPCKKGQLEVFLQQKGRDLLVREQKPGRRTCVRPRRPTLRDNPLLSRSERRRMRRGLMGRAVRDRRAARQLARMLAAPPVARPSRKTDHTIEQRREVEPGVEHWGDLVRTSPDPDELGHGSRTTSVVEMDAAKLDKRQKPGKATIRTFDEAGNASFGKRCPDSAGRIPLEYSSITTQAKSVIANGRRTVFGFSIESRATGHGQVGDDAHAKSFSYRTEVDVRMWAHTVRESDGELLDRKPTRTLSGTFEDVDVPIEHSPGEKVAGRWRTGRTGNLSADTQAHLAAVAQGEGDSPRFYFRKLLRDAERIFFWDRTCVKLVFLPDSGTDFEAGGTEGVDVEARAVVDGKGAQGGSIRPLRPNGPCTSGVITPQQGNAPRARFILSDVVRGWSEDAPPCILIDAATRAGRPPVESFVWSREEPPPPSFPWRYEVLDASLEETTSASRMNGLCDAFGPTAGSIRFAGGFAYGSESTVDRRSDGTLDGRLAARVNARWTDHQLKGCKSGQGGTVACQAKAPDLSPGGDGTWGVSASVRAESESSPTATLVWSVNNPSVGFFDAGDDECNVDIVGFLPYETLHQEVPMARLSGTGPQALEFTGAVHLDKHMDRDPASIDHAWTLRLTIRRVDAEGRPL